jgi:putative ABC transport system permease protein
VTPGFAVEHALAAELPFSSARYDNDEHRTSTVQQVIDRVCALPGVRSAAVTTFLPMSGAGATIHFNIKGRPPAGPDRYALAGYRAVSGKYFETLGIRLVRGRRIDERDRQGSLPVIVINETMARTYFGRENPLGQRIQLGALPDPDPQLPYMEVVGVVGDVRQTPDAEAKSEMYVPYAQYPDQFLKRMYSNVNLIVRAEGRAPQLAAAVRDVVRGIDSDQPVANIRSLDDVIAASVTQPRFRTLLLALFAGLALALAGVGVYGLLAHGVAQRLNEFGIRLALGASPSGVLRLVLREGLTLAAVGLAVGALGAAIAVRALSTVIYDVSPWDPLAWIAAIVTLLAVALLASWLPARRALRVDPVVALRY